MRFTLKTLITAVSVAAVLCCIFFTLPSILAIALMGLAWMLVPPALIAGIVYGRGYGRTFSIGCVSTGGIFPIFWIYAWMLFAGVISDLDSPVIDKEAAIAIKLVFGASCLLTGLSGLSSMAVRWISLRMAKANPPLQTPSPIHYSVLHRRVSTLPAKVASPEDDDADASI